MRAAELSTATSLRLRGEGACAREEGGVGAGVGLVVLVLLEGPLKKIKDGGVAADVLVYERRCRRRTIRRPSFCTVPPCRLLCILLYGRSCMAWPLLYSRAWCYLWARFFPVLDVMRSGRSSYGLSTAVIPVKGPDLVNSRGCVEAHGGRKGTHPLQTTPTF